MQVLRVRADNGMHLLRDAVERAEQLDDFEIRVRGQGTRSLTAAMIGVQRAKLPTIVLDPDGEAAQVERISRQTDRRDGVRHAKRPWKIGVLVGYSPVHAAADAKLVEESKSGQCPERSERSELVWELNDRGGRGFVYWGVG